MTKFIALIFAIFLTVSTVTAQNSRIVWEKDFKKSLASARQTGKPILIYFYAPDCQSCREMDEEFWSGEAIAKSIQSFVAIKLNLENEKPTAAKYNVVEAPFVAFADPLGNLISFQKGFDKSAVRRLNLGLKEVTKDFTSLEKSYQAIGRKKDDGAALLEIADAYRNWGIIFLSSEFYRRALKTDEVANDEKEKERVSFALGINAVGYKDYKQAIDLLENYLKNYPRGIYAENSLTLLIVSHANLEKFNESDKYLERLKTEFPDSKNIAVALKAIENAKNKTRK